MAFQSGASDIRPRSAVPGESELGPDIQAPPHGRPGTTTALMARSSSGNLISTAEKVDQGPGILSALVEDRTDYATAVFADVVKP
jgi:hypothetical protein